MIKYYANKKPVPCTGGVHYPYFLAVTEITNVKFVIPFSFDVTSEVSKATNFVIKLSANQSLYFFVTDVIACSESRDVLENEPTIRSV